MILSDDNETAHHDASTTGIRGLTLVHNVALVGSLPWRQVADEDEGMVVAGCADLAVKRKLHPMFGKLALPTTRLRVERGMCPKTLRTCVYATVSYWRTIPDYDDQPFVEDLFDATYDARSLQHFHVLATATTLRALAVDLLDHIFHFVED
jgi:hypothetical protein